MSSRQVRERSQLTRVEKVEDALRDILKDLKECRLSQRDIVEIKDQLCRIDELMHDAAIPERDGSILPGQAMLAEMLNEAHELSSELMENMEDSQSEED
ncbi:hypothetical protein HDU77_004026 [Chytriomyces hyalinus]|nr:hypothetical protein HDU77_004026 [Chytriomyces hyalinus]